MSKKIIFNEEARKKIERGANIVADAVSITLGPKGRNVIVDRQWRTPLITNDGVSIAKEIELSDPFENVGAQLIKEVASATNDIAGDGTTTATILTRKMISEGIKNITAGANGILVKNGMMFAAEKITNKLSEFAIKINTNNEIYNVAKISSNSEEIGALIAEAVKEVGKIGIVSIADSALSTCSVSYVNGIKIKSGWMYAHMVTDTTHNIADLTDVHFLLYDGSITNINDMRVLLEKFIAKYKDNPLIIIADNIDNDALAFLLVNKLQGVISVYGIKSPGYGEIKTDMMEDLAVSLGATYIRPFLGMSINTTELSDLGFAKHVKITKDDTTITDYNGSKEEIDIRKNQLKKEMELSTKDYVIAKLDERIANLEGKAAVINVGAKTEVEQNDLRLRIEDALNSTKAAIDSGIVPGAGSALIFAGLEVEKDIYDVLDGDALTGAKIVLEATKEPLKTIAKNCGDSPEVILNSVVTTKFFGGYDAMNGIVVDNIVDLGIIDPVLVTKTAFEKSTSIAGMILTTDAIITNDTVINSVSEDGSMQHLGKIFS